MNLREVQQRFDDAAGSFDSADFVHAATRDGLFARLEPMTLDAARIIDLGSATGASALRLGKSFRRATVIPVDVSRGMIERAARRSMWFSKRPAIQADAAQLPIASHTIDLVFSNLLLPWLDDRDRVFAEVGRVLAGDGLFVFSTLGPDSLGDLRHPDFVDMHDVGDELVRAGLRDPVLDVDRLTVTYRDRDRLENDLRAVGAGDCLPEGTAAFDLEFELIYGHCWGSGISDTREVRIDPRRIGRRGA